MRSDSFTLKDDLFKQVLGSRPGKAFLLTSSERAPIFNEMEFVALFISAFQVDPRTYLHILLSIEQSYLDFNSFLASFEWPLIV